MKKDARTVLVVDDDPEWLDFLSRVIGAEYPVLHATSGEDAIRRAQSAVPDVIILDVMMPGGKDGFTTYSKLQSDPRTRGIPVLMLTEVTRKTGLPFGTEDMKQYLGKAPAAFFEKPISAKRLMDEIRKALGREPLNAGVIDEVVRLSPT